MTKLDMDLKRKYLIGVVVAILTLFPYMAIADSDADQLLEKVSSATKFLKSFRFKGTANISYKRDSGSYERTDVQEVAFKRPNLFTIESENSKVVSDGNTSLSIFNQFYSKSPIDPYAENFHWHHNDLYIFYVTGSLEKALEPPQIPKAKMLADEVWNGETYRIVSLEVGGGYPISYKLYIGKDNLIHRLVHDELNYGKHNILDFSVTELEINPELEQKAFVQELPSGVKPAPKLEGRDSTPLISVGETAVDFSLPTPNGRRLPMSEMLKGKKALLLNFWFIKCPPCRAEHPHLNKLYNELKDKGLELLAIDDQDEPEQVAKYMRDAKLDFLTVLTGPRFAKDPKTGQIDYSGPSLPDYASLAPYGVHSCPTNILIGPDGKVAYVSIGWNEQALRQALAKLGVQ